MKGEFMRNQWSWIWLPPFFPTRSTDIATLLGGTDSVKAGIEKSATRQIILPLRYFWARRRWWAPQYHIGALVSVALLLSISQPSAETKQLKFLDTIKGIETAKRAEVIILPPDIYFRTVITEITLARHGCTYVTENLSHIDDIIEILKRANLTLAESPDESSVLEPQVSVTLSLADGNIIVFYFEREFINSNLVRGYYYNTDLKTSRNLFELQKQKNLTAELSMINKLILWSVGVGATFSDNPLSKDSCQSVNNIGESLK